MHHHRCIVDPTLFPVDADGHLCVPNGSAALATTTTAAAGPEIADTATEIADMTTEQTLTTGALAPGASPDTVAPPSVTSIVGNVDERPTKKRAVDIRSFFGAKSMEDGAAPAPTAANTSPGSTIVDPSTATANVAAASTATPTPAGTPTPIATPTGNGDARATGCATSVSSTAQIGAWFTPAAVAVDAGGNVLPVAAAANAMGHFDVGDSVTAQWAGKGAW